ncbi:endonuclease, partial [Pseudokineococcus marinus]|nr:endonuclease [Pseudokineococcus marinus]
RAGSRARIDALLVRGARVRSAQVLDAAGASDHAPLVAELEVPAA